jgi:hypothetical protein
MTMKRERLAATYAEFIVDLLPYEELCARAEEAIKRDVLEGLENGSITEDQLFDEMEKD